MNSRVVGLVSAMFFTILGIWGEHALHAGPISDAQTELATNQATLVSVRQLLVREPALNAELQQLSTKYLTHSRSTAALESVFVTDLNHDASKHHTWISSVTWESGVSQSGAVGAIERMPGQIGPTMPALASNLFSDLPAIITITGTWKDVVETLADIPLGRSLVLLSQPSAKSSGNTVSISARLDLLKPTVGVLP